MLAQVTEEVHLVTRSIAARVTHDTGPPAEAVDDTRHGITLAGRCSISVVKVCVANVAAQVKDV